MRYHGKVPSPKELPAELLKLAASRHGCVTARELRDLAVTRGLQGRRVANGNLVPMTRGVVAVAELIDPWTPVAAWQLAYPTLVAERRTSAAIWGLAGAAEAGIVDLDLVAPTSRRVERRGAPSFRVFALPDKAVTETQGLRVTTVTWTLGELGAAPDVDADRVELALESALHARLTTEGQLRKVLEYRSGPQWPGTDVLAAALARRQPGAPPTESYAETRFLQRIVRPLELEDPERQVPFGSAGQRRLYRADFVFRRRGALNVEIDGRGQHGDATAHDHDTLRDHVARVNGLQVVRFSAWRIDHRQREVQRFLLAELERVA